MRLISSAYQLASSRPDRTGWRHRMVLWRHGPHAMVRFLLFLILRKQTSKSLFTVGFSQSKIGLVRNKWLKERW